MTKKKNTGIPPGYKKNFDTILLAASEASLAILQAWDKQDKKEVCLVVACQREKNGDTTMVPLAMMLPSIDGENPFYRFVPADPAHVHMKGHLCGRDCKGNVSDPPTVHVLLHGWCLCGVMGALAPVNWPEGHSLISFNATTRDQDATCEDCKKAVVEVLKQREKDHEARVADIKGVLVIKPGCHPNFIVRDTPVPLKELQDLVGGFIEGLNFDAVSDVTIYINEEGRIKGLDLNAFVDSPEVFRGKAWDISGPIVVLGGVHGCTDECPEDCEKGGDTELLDKSKVDEIMKHIRLVGR